MDKEEIKDTEIWTLYQKHVDFCRMRGYFTDVDRCNNFYDGNQWEGLKIEGVEPIQFNFIMPIVDHKVSKITQNLRAINYSADNVEGTEFRAKAKKVCDLFNQRAARVWENDQMDIKVKRIVRQAAINSEGIMYVSFDEEENNPKNEILNKLDIFYGNEQESNIQLQPYILCKQRMSVVDAMKLAEDYGISKEKQEYLVGDDETEDEAGTDAKYEVDNMVTIVTKFYRDNGTIHYSKAARKLDICKDEDMGTSFYPFSHMAWKDKEGSARGEGEVRTLISNQIEANKNALRRLIATKNTAYPQKIIAKDKITNPEAVNQIGGTIEVEGMDIDDVRKIFSSTQPAQMSADAEKIQMELISTTRELRNASETATGQINPEDASGRAILAVQQAAEQPLADQNQNLNTMIEDLARIWMDMWKTHNKKEGMKLENIETNPQTGEDTITIEKVPASTLDKLRTSVKIDITPKGAFDKYAQERSLENLSQTQQFMDTAWLEDYVSLLDNDAVMPKMKLEELIDKRKKAQQQIRAIQAAGNIMQTRIQQMMNTGEIVPREMNQMIPQGEAM
jgi:Tfp pilus assembly protein PilE